MLSMVIGYLFLFIFRPWEYWTFLAPLRIERVYMITLLVLLFFWRQKRYVPHAITRLVLAFFAVLVLSSIMALRWPDAYDATFDYFKLIVFYFVIIFAVKDEQDLKRFVTAYLVIMLLYVGKSAWEFFVNDRYVWRMGLRRLAGIDTTYGDPNALAGSIAYSLPFLWAMIKYRPESPLMRKLLRIYGILAWLSIIFTGSRSGMVTSLLFLLLVWFGASRKVVAVIVLCAALFFTWNIMPQRYQIRFESTFIKGIAPKGTDESARGRIEGLKQGVRTFAKYPLLGIGPGNFKYSWDRYRVGGSAHNLYGEMLGETGGLGFLAFFSLVFMILRTHRRIIEATDLSPGAAQGMPPERARKLLLLRYLSTASVQAVVLLLFNGNFGHNLYRYNWLWIGAMGVLSAYFLRDELSRPSAVHAFRPDEAGRSGFGALPEQS